MTSPSPSPRVAAALDHLRDDRERLTPARVAVLQVIDAADTADEHLTAEQIGARVAEVEPSVHRATVYRTLTSLTDAGLLSHVHLGGSATVYHLATPPRQPARPDGESAAYGIGGQLAPAHTHGHAHVQCATCGRVQDAPPRLLEDAARQLRDVLGFELDTGHAALLGTCRDCNRGTAHDTTARRAGS